MNFNLKQTLKTKKVKYGSYSVMFTVAFVAFVIIFNVIFSALASKYMWYIDMTDAEIYSLSDATYELLKDVEDEIVITFCMEKDELEADGSMHYILNTARLLEKEFDNVTIDYRDVLTNNVYLEKYTTTSSPHVPTTSVIVESGTEFRLFSYTSFFITDTEDSDYVWAYKGEEQFVSAILQVTADEMPIAYFTSGHGEALNSDEDAAALIQLFYNAGYEVRAIDLSEEEIDPAARVIIINDPKYDFGGYSEESTGDSEIEKIDKFLDGLGSLFVFVDPKTVGDLPNLNEFLYEWGIEFEPGVSLVDEEHAISVDGSALVGQYNNNEEELASSIYKQVTSMSNWPKVIFRDACPINKVYTSKSFGIDSRIVSDVFMTADTAHKVSDGTVSEETGVYSLMTISQETRIRDNEYYTSYVLASGCTDFTSSRYLLSNVYANSDVLYACMRAFGKERVPADIDFKVFNDNDLDITTEQANSWTRAFISVMPLITVAAAVVVTVRRKYK